MKKLLRLTKLLLTAALFGVGQSVWAQAVPTVGATVSTGDFYFYNLGSGTYLSRGSSWTMHATVDGAGFAYTIGEDGENAYNLHCNDGALSATDFMSPDGWLNHNSSYSSNKDYTTWTFIPVVVEGYANVYKIQANFTGKEYFLCWSGGTGEYGNEVVGKSATDYEAVDAKNGYWLLIPKATREAYIDASLSNFIDATWRIKNPDHERIADPIWIGNYSRVSYGAIGTANYFDYFIGENGTANGQTLADNNVYQTLSGLPKGQYRLSMDACAQYQGSSDEVTGVELYAGENRTSMSGATSTNYHVDFISDGSDVNIGIKVTSTNANWVIADNTRLTYIDPCLSVIAEEFTSGSEMVADKWYYADFVAKTYNFEATTLSDVVYVDADQLLSVAASASDNFSASQEMAAGRYYFKSTSSQTLTFEEKAAVKVTETYDFTLADHQGNFTYVGNYFTYSTGSWGYNVSDPWLNNRFTFADGTSQGVHRNYWTVRTFKTNDKNCTGLNNTQSGNKILGINNLKDGDILIFNNTSAATKNLLACSTNLKEEGSEDVLTANSELTFGTRYVVSTTDETTMVEVYGQQYGCVTSIQIITSEIETITKPTLTVTPSGTDRKVTIASGTSNSFGSPVITYYTLDGTEPTTESNVYTSPLVLSEGCTVKAISVAIGGTVSDVESIEVSPGEAVSTTVGANGYSTFASPYALDLTDANRPAGLKAYKATLSGTTLSFEKLNQTVPAGTGLLLLGETPSANYTIPVVAEGVSVGNNALVGVTSETQLQSAVDGNYYFVMKKADAALTFAPLTTESPVTIPAGKAYVEVPASAFATPGGARSLAISFIDDVTGINTVDAAENHAEGIYNLNGQRVVAPSKGLYIMNGKKVIMK